MRPLLLVLVVLAGCSGLAADPTPSASVTPAPLPEATPTPADPYPPGVDAGGVTDPGALTRAHATALSGVSFIATRVETRRTANGTLRERHERTVRRGADPRAFVYRLDSTLPAGNRTIERWSNATHAFEAVTRDGNRTVSELPGGFPAEYATGEQGLDRLFSLLDTRLDGTVTRNGTRLHRIVAAPGATIPPSITDVTFEALVDERGLVRSYTISYTIDYEGERLRIDVQVRFSALDSTTVPRPDWVPGEAPETNATTETATRVHSPG